MLPRRHRLSRRGFLRTATAALAGAWGQQLGFGTAAGEPGGRPNILFIAIDDLRPELGCYGESHMITPHLDGFAATARRFDRHYVVVPTCGASRCAMFTSQQPRGKQRLGNGAFGSLKRERTEDPQTLPECFRRAGYRTVSIGKLSHQPDGHVYSYDGKGDGHEEVPFGWDDAGLPYGKWKYGWGAFFGYANGLGRTFYPQATVTEAADVDDSGYPDGLIAEAAIAQLRDLKQRGGPFFLGVGFFKPHLPWCAPKKYWDLYDPEKLPLSPNFEKPDNINPSSWHGSGECFSPRYNHDPKLKADPAHARHLRHGYFACVSYVDAQVGKVLAELERLGLADNTVVVVWGDHGWHLGDHLIWGKHTNFERALRSALLIRQPGMPAPGQASEALTSGLDLYPTLADLCGVPTPPSVEGKSLRPALADPAATVNDAVFSFWRNGVTMRTERYRLTGYSKGRPAVELYDHRTDPNETHNAVAEQPEVAARLLPRLRERARQVRGLELAP